MVRIDFNTFQLQQLAVATNWITQAEHDIYRARWIAIIGEEGGDTGAVWIDNGDGLNPTNDGIPNITAAQLATAIMQVINVAGNEILDEIDDGTIPAYPRPGAPHGAPQTDDAAFARVFTLMAQMVGHAAGGHATPLAQLFTMVTLGIVHNWIQHNGPGHYEEPWGFPGTYDNPNGPVLQMDCPGDNDPGDPGRRRLMTHTWNEGPPPAHPGDLPVAGHWSGCRSGGCTPMLNLYDLCPPSSQCELQHSNVDATCGNQKRSGFSDCVNCMDQHYPGTSCDIDAWCGCPAKNLTCNSATIQHCPPQWWLDKHIGTGKDAPIPCMTCTGIHQKMMRDGNCTHQDLDAYCSSPEDTCVSESDMERQRANDMYCGVYINKNQCIGDTARNCCWRSEDADRGAYCFAGSEHKGRRDSGLCVDTPHPP